VRDGWSYFRFRKAEVLHLALLDEVFQQLRRHLRSEHWDRRDADRQVDDISLEAFERGVGDLLYMFWTTVETSLFACVRIKLNPNLVAITTWSRSGASASPTSSSLVKGTVNFGGIEERYATLDGCPNQRDHLLFVRSRTITEAHPMQPRPMADTSRLLFPSLRVFIVTPTLQNSVYLYSSASLSIVS